MEPTPPTRRRYRRRPEQAVAAVQLKLDTEGLRFRKWGHKQWARPGDWLVDNDGEVYTVAADVFAATYRKIATGAYLKTSPVWAEQAREPGQVATKEGHTDYAAGDWLVSNQADGSDAYAMPAERFEALYEPDGDA